MATKGCPVCGGERRLLKASTDLASVKYYRCDACGHVWTTKKGNSDMITHVTEDRRASRRRPKSDLKKPKR